MAVPNWKLPFTVEPSGAWKKWFSLAVELLAGIPSIVMGLSGFALILFLKKTVAPQANT